MVLSTHVALTLRQSRAAVAERIGEVRGQTREVPRAQCTIHLLSVCRSQHIANNRGAIDQGEGQARLEIQVRSHPAATKSLPIVGVKVSAVSTTVSSEKADSVHSISVLFSKRLELKRGAGDGVGTDSVGVN